MMNPTSAEYCLLWIDWWPMCMTKAEWAGWAQALGAIAAILFGFVYIHLQHKYARVSAEVAARSRHRSVLKAVLIAVSEGVAVCLAARVQLEEDLPDWTLVEKEVGRAHETLSQFQLLQLRDPDLMQRVNLAKLELRALISNISTLRGLYMTAERMQNTVSLFDQRQNLLERIVQWVDAKSADFSTSEELASDETADVMSVEPFEWQESGQRATA